MTYKPIEWLELLGAPNGSTARLAFGHDGTSVLHVRIDMVQPAAGVARFEAHWEISNGKQIVDRIAKWFELEKAP